MREMYRKAGRVIRSESAHLIQVDEMGQAIEEDSTFTAAPVSFEVTVPDLDRVSVVNASAAVARAAEGLTLERAIVSEGIAVHHCNDVSWTDVARRIHVSLARPPYRALIDLADFDTRRIDRAAAALQRVRGMRDIAHLRLADNVGAALLPSLIGVTPIRQWAAPHDGKGQWIENVNVEGGVPPNWYRPSYRSRPLRAWFHLRADPAGTVDRELPEAIALLAPIHGRTMSVLCLDGDDAFAATINVTRIQAIVPTAGWYPYAAGCFGAEIML